MAHDKGRDASDTTLPMADRDTAHLPGHWLLARLGKRVLRPGGRELTERMLTDADLTGADVLELAPGLGKTARSILAWAARCGSSPTSCAMPTRAAGYARCAARSASTDTTSPQSR